MLKVPFIPNSNELSEIVQQTQQALSKYFHLDLSPKRSEKLRDFVCESLGFTNGGYQQLQALWAAQRVVAVQMTCRLVLTYGARQIDAIVIESVSQHLNAINCVASCLGREHDIMNNTGFTVNAQTITHNQRAGSDVANEDYSFFIFVGGMIVGKAKTNADAALFSALLLVARNDFNAAFTPVEHSDMNRNPLADQFEPRQKTPSNLLLLRASSEDSGLLFEFNDLTARSVITPSNELRQTITVHTPSYGVLTIEYSDALHSYVFNGIPFDIAVAYCEDQGSELHLNTPSDGKYATWERCEFDGAHALISTLNARDTVEGIVINNDSSSFNLRISRPNRTSA